MVLIIAPVPSSRTGGVRKCNGKNLTPGKKPNHGSKPAISRHPKTKTPTWKHDSGKNFNSIFSRRFGTLGAVLRACAQQNAALSRSSMTTSPGGSSTSGAGGISFEVNCKLSKVFYSVPRKCSQCDKILMFTAYACQFCRYRVHRKCANFDESETLPSCKNRCSLSKLPADEGLFAKLIRENEINANDMDVFLEECSQLLKARSQSSGSRVGLRHSFSSRTVIYSDSSEADSGEWSGRRYLKHRSARTRSPSHTERCHHHSFSESWDSNTSVSATCGYLSADGGYSSPPPPTVMINRLWQLFSRAQAAAFSGKPVHKDSAASNGWATTLSSSWGGDAPSTPSNKPSVTESDSGYPSDCGNSSAIGARSRRSTRLTGGSASPHGDRNLFLNRDSLRLRLTLPSPNGPLSSASSGLTTPIRTPVDEFNDSLVQDILRNPSLAESDVMRRRSKWIRCILGERGARSQDSVTHGSADVLPHDLLNTGQIDPSVTPIANRAQLCEKPPYAIVSPLLTAKAKLCATWPISGLHLNYDKDDMGDIDYPDRYWEGKDSEQDTKSLGLGEWTIPFEELELKNCVLDGRDMKVHTGKWHGNVMIHIFKTDCCQPRTTDEFKREVHELAKLRHENIVLFMGVCVEPPNLAVVTGAHSGDSLYDLLHVKRKRQLSDHSKLSIARQIAQAVGYMHEKGIVLKTLSSRNIYLESKVRISIVDQGCPKSVVSPGATLSGQLNYGYLAQSQLLYFSPELITTLYILPPYASVLPLHTQQTDVWAFGTVLYELFEQSFPLHICPPHSIIWLIGTGQLLEEVSFMSSPHRLRSLIQDCWYPDPILRPTFLKLYADLGRMLRLTRHISTEPKIFEGQNIPEGLTDSRPLNTFQVMLLNQLTFQKLNSIPSKKYKSSANVMLHPLPHAALPCCV